jgi:PAS domain S-box-containing protein
MDEAERPATEADRLELLTQGIRDFARALTEPRRLLDVVVERAASVLDCAAVVLLLREDGQSLAPFAVFHADPRVVNAIQELAGGEAPPLSTSHPVVETLRAEDHILQHEFSDEFVRRRFPRAGDVARFARLQVQSWVGVPMLAGGSLVGVLNLMRLGPAARRFEQADVGLARSLAEAAGLALAHARLLQSDRLVLAERERIAERLRLLTRLSKEFAAATGDYRELLRLVARRTGEALSDACVIRMLSADGTSLVDLEVSYLRQPEQAAATIGELRARPNRLGHGVSGRVAETGQSLLISAPTAAELARKLELDAQYAGMLEAAGVTSIVCVALRVEARVAGVILLSRQAGAAPFDEHDRELLEDVAAHAALAITNARLLAQAKGEVQARVKLTERLRALSVAARDFASAQGDTTAVLDRVSSRVGEILGDMCVIRLLEPDGTHLGSLGSVYHPDPAQMEALRVSLLAERIAVGAGLTGKVVATGQPVFISEEPAGVIPSQVEPRYRSLSERLDLRGTIIVPLLAAGRILGAIGVSRGGAGRAYEQDDLELLQNLAAHASLAIVNSQLLEASKRELSERMQTEQVLRRGFLEAAPDAVVISDTAGTIVLVNSQAESLFGYTRAELVGAPTEILLAERLRQKQRTGRAEFVREPTRRTVGAGGDVVGRRKDGAEFLIEVTVSPIVSPDGTMLLASAIRDVTERQRELDERRRKIEEADRLKSEFLANMSHELRTPLNAIIGFATLMRAGKTGPIGEAQKEYLGDILNSSRHLLQLINDVLDLSKVESGKLDVYAELVEPGQVLSEVLDIVRALAVERGLTLDRHVDAELGRVRTDPRLLKQVLYNFLSNAIKFTGEGGRVSTRITAEGDMFRLAVTDTGIGIKPQDVGRLFTAFRQLDSGSNKKYAGTGLGLSLTKRIVELQGGRVEVESTFGTGSTFSAILPRESSARMRRPSTVNAPVSQKPSER